MSNVPYKNTKQKYPYKVTQKVRAAFNMSDEPIEEEGGWQGYFHFQDPTTLKPNTLTYPSVNCMIPYKDKIVPRLGTTLLGQKYTTGKNWPIIGHKKRFATMSGIEVEVRVTQSDDANLKDIIEVLYPDPVTDVLTWYKITQLTNSLTPAVGKLGMEARYYFDSWFDTNLNPALSLNLPRLVGTNGTTQVLNWTGGMAPIVSFIANTSITTTAGVSWASLGFVSPALGGSGVIVINGLPYTITGGWATDTLTTASTTGIANNDVAFSQIQVDTAPIAFDVCRQNQNYMFYGSWFSRKLFMSNGFEKDPTQIITNAQAVQNDLVVGTTDYSGTGQHTYTVTIDSVNPEIDQQTFISGGQGNLNDAHYNTGSYSGTAGITNTYNVLMVANLDITITTADIVGGPFLVGDIVRGSVTLAEGQITAILVTGTFTTFALNVLTSNSFDDNDTLQDLRDTGTTSGVSTLAIINQNWFTYTKNGATVTIAGATVNPVPNGTQTLTDGLTITFSNYFGHAVGDSWQLIINRGGADTFQYKIDGASPVATHVPITGAAQSLGSNINITFVNKTGHTLGDTWTITATQGVTKAWINFYYTLPVRAPGEGYVYQLPSNFWAMEPQESEMYVNTTYGYWSYVTTQLSADLQSESVSLTPLKQSSTSKVIFPYMISHLDNDIIYVTTNKTLDLIGRLELIQLPQIDSLSQPVQLDFDGLSFKNGSMEYFNKQLFITSPDEGMMLVYDDKPKNKYWQPPQVIPENGILSIVGNTLISHSNVRNQTFNLFTGRSGDTGSNYTVVAQTPYWSMGDRWGQKSTNRTFIEGYITGAPEMKLVTYLGINGCGGIFPNDVKPTVCISPTNAPFGEGAFGKHSNGSGDPIANSSYFNAINPDFDPILTYYFISLRAQCTATNHSYSWLTLGVNRVVANVGNDQLINTGEIPLD